MATITDAQREMMTRLLNTSKARFLRRGAAGVTVRALQLFLRDQGYDIRADGRFGPKTERAVREYQAREKIGSDGIAGSRMFREMRRKIRETAAVPQPVPEAEAAPVPPPMPIEPSTPMQQPPMPTLRPDALLASPPSPRSIVPPSPEPRAMRMQQMAPGYMSGPSTDTGAAQRAAEQEIMGTILRGILTARPAATDPRQIGI